jgi:hypothetical protein
MAKKCRSTPINLEDTLKSRLGNKWQLYKFIFLPHEDTRATWRMGGTIRRYGDRITPPTIEPQYFLNLKKFLCMRQ